MNNITAGMYANSLTDNWMEGIHSSLTQNSERFQRLIEHLPEKMKADIFNYDLKEEILNEQLKELKLFSMLTDNNLYEVSKMTILAYRINKITFEEMVTVFMHLGAVEELYLNQKMTMQILDKNAAYHSFTCYVKKMDPSFFPFLQKGFIRATFGITPRAMLKNQELDNEYIEKLENQDKLDLPHIKKFFYFEETEWKQFCEKMQAAPENEQLFTFLRVPEYGCWSTLYRNIVKVIRCFHITKCLARPNLLNMPPKKVKYLLLPSFTMMQTALQIKALAHNRKAMELVPHFGMLSYDDLLALKKKDQSPFGLYCPTPPEMNSETTLKHMRIVDGHGGSGPISFMYHDAYHVLRWQEMNEETAKAVLYAVDVLNAYSKSLVKGSDKYKELRKLCNKLVDGELIFSYPRENSLFQYRPFTPEKFGHIFEHTWSPDLKDQILFNFAKNQFFWKKNFNITYSDLMYPEAAIAYLMNLLFDDLAPSPIFDIHIQDENNPLRNILEVKNVQIINSTIRHLSCDKALILNSKIDFIQATHHIAIGNTNIKSIKIDTPKAFIINCEKVESITGASQGIIIFWKMRSTSCSKVHYPNILWEIASEKQLTFDEFECNKLYIEGNWENKLHIELKNCKIGTIAFFKNTEEEVRKLIGAFTVKFLNSHCDSFFAYHPSTDNTTLISYELELTFTTTPKNK
jgi:hypothetical protein